MRGRWLIVVIAALATAGCLRSGFVVWDEFDGSFDIGANAQQDAAVGHLADRSSSDRDVDASAADGAASADRPSPSDRVAIPDATPGEQAVGDALFAAEAGADAVAGDLLADDHAVYEASHRLDRITPDHAITGDATEERHNADAEADATGSDTSPADGSSDLATADGLALDALPGDALTGEGGVPVSPFKIHLP